MFRNAKHGKKNRRVFLLAAVILVVFMLAGGLAFNHIRNPLRLLKNPPPDNLAEAEEILEGFDEETINFVLLGFDRTAARDAYSRLYRPDTIMIASIDFGDGGVKLLNIPRDSYVQIAGTDFYDKINHAYMYGHDARGLEDEKRRENGIRTVVETVEDLLGGVPIHYYMTVDMDGVVEIIDKLGGIYYDVELQVRHATTFRLEVDKGYQLLDGRAYLEYLRYRGVGGDTGRAGRQQKLVMETFRQLRQAGKLVRLPQLYGSLTETVETNLTAAQMAALALYGKNIDMSGVATYVMPGSTQWGPVGNLDVAYYVIDEQARVQLIKEIFGVDVPPRRQITLPGPRAGRAPQGVIESPRAGEQPLEGAPEAPAVSGQNGEPGGEEPAPAEPQPQEPQPPAAEEPALCPLCLSPGCLDLACLQ